VQHDLPSLAAPRLRHPYLLRRQRLSRGNGIHRPTHPSAGDEPLAVFVSAILLPMRGAAATLQAHSVRAGWADSRVCDRVYPLISETRHRPGASAANRGCLVAALMRKARREGNMKAQVARQQSNQRKAILEIAAVFSNSRLDEDQRNAKACNVLSRYCKNVTLEREEAILDTAAEVSEMVLIATRKMRNATSNSKVQETHDAIALGEGDASRLDSGAVETTAAHAISSHQAAVNSLFELSVAADEPDVPFDQVPARFRSTVDQDNAAGNRNPYPEETDLIEYALMLIDRNGGNANIRTPEQEQFYADLAFGSFPVRVAYSPEKVTVH
jgi:hypothetical protein